MENCSKNRKVSEQNSSFLSFCPMFFAIPLSFYLLGIFMVSLYTIGFQPNPSVTYIWSQEVPTPSSPRERIGDN